MDLIYTVSRKCNSKIHSTDETNNVTDDNCKHLIRVSSNNIVAWVTQYDLNDVSNTTTGSQVYVSDCNMPWNFYKVTSNKGLITTLEWDLHGDYLLIGDSYGTVSVWSYKDHVFNDWICIGSADFVGEYIIAGTFFHSGRKISLINEKRESFLYYEKFKHDRFYPTVRSKGGTPIDGCFIVTSTGMIAALLILGEAGVTSLTTTTDIIASTRYKISVADICYRNNGHLVVAASSGCRNMPVQCYDIAVQYVNEKVTHINSQHLPGFFLDGVVSTADNAQLHITGLKFVIREAPDLLIVVVSTNVGSIVQIWQLVDGPYYFNNLLGGDNNCAVDEFKTISWRCQTSVSFDSDVVSLATPKLLINNCVPPSFHILAAFKDNSIRVLTKTLKEESNYNFNTYWDMEVDVKRSGGFVNISDMDITWLGNVFIVLDTSGNFYLFQLHIVPELGSPLTVMYAVSQLEYCLVTGLDWWDLTISMRPNMLEAVCERFTDNFLKQPQAIQQYEYCKFLSIKASLYRMLGNAHSKNVDFVFLMTLYSISTAFKSLLRPSDLSSPDKGPGETLGNVLLDSITDVDKVLMNLEAKEFTVEPSALQSLQQLIQWVAHLSLNILARVPEHRKCVTGYDILTDVQALSMLREMLVIIRIWGLLRASCLPIFIRNVDNFDGISTLFRLISRLVQCNQNNEIDDSLIDDCCLLQNQVLIPMLNSVPREVCDVASPAFYYQSLPIQFSFGQEPESFVYEMETVNLDGGLQTTQNSDIIRHVYLGKYPSIMKQCNRCEGKTQVVSNAKTAAIRSWENRWIKTCVCGGKWRYVRSNPPVYSRKPWIGMSRASQIKS